MCLYVPLLSDEGAIFELCYSGRSSWNLVVEFLATLLTRPQYRGGGGDGAFFPTFRSAHVRSSLPPNQSLSEAAGIVGRGGGPQQEPKAARTQATEGGRKGGGNRQQLMASLAYHQDRYRISANLGVSRDEATSFSLSFSCRRREIIQ